MAGIGFRLEKILSKNSYANLLEGYLFSAIVSAGPLLCTIFAIGILSLISSERISLEEIMVFRTLIVYIFAASLITSSPFQMIITRFMADRIFIKDFAAIVPSFVGTVIIIAMINATIGYAAMPALSLDTGTEITSVILFVEIGIIWIAMIVLSAAKEFSRILNAFALGSLLSVVAGYFGGLWFGLVGLCVGFTMGQTLLLILLVIQIFTEFDYRPNVEFYFLEYFKKYSSLALIATLYNIGIWADKFVFWFNPSTGEQIRDFLHASYIYDVPVFLAFLFIIPTLAMFTIRIETSFYPHYRKYFLAIMNKHPFYALEERRKNIVSDLKLSLGRLIVLQGTITAVGIVAAAKIYGLFRLAPMHLGIFQIVLLAVFLQALLQTLLIMILYFDFRKDALILATTFAVTNIVFTLYSVQLGFAYYGYGYFASCLVSLMVGFALFNVRLRHLHYHTFVSQKIISHTG